MIFNKSCKNFLKYSLLLSSVSYIRYVKAESECSSNLDCAKHNTGVDTYVCIRWNGQADNVCYLESEAYCDTDAFCQGIDKSLKFCYVPPWITNKNSQKQCFTIHAEGGTCIEDSHCNSGLVCVDNVCTAGSAKPAADNTNNNSTDTKKSTSSKEKSNNKDEKTSTSSVDLEYDDISAKKKPIEIMGLPLWVFIIIATVPIIFFIVIIWGISIGRRSYNEEEERKKNKMVFQKNKKEFDTNYKGASSENLINSNNDSSSDFKNEMMNAYLNTGSAAVTSISSSSNSTIANNLTTATIPGANALNNRSSQATLEAPKLKKNKKSNSNLSAVAGKPAKPKKPKSIVNSEYSDTNSHKGLLNSGAAMGGAESGIYSNYFGGGAASTVSSSYFGQTPVMNDQMNAYYYQQMMANQQMQAQQMMANQYYMDNGMGAMGAMGAMPSVDMMQYQQLYGGMGGMLNNQMAYPNMNTAPTTTKKKHKK